MTIPENIKRLRMEAGLTQEQLAEKLGVTRPTVTQWETGWSQPRMGMANKLAEIFGVSISSIVDELGGRSQLPKDAIRAIASPTYAPVYGSISAGIPLDANEDREEDLWVSPDVQEAHPNGFFLRINGDSMDKIYPDGGYVYLDPDIMPKSGDIGAVIINGCEATVKRLHITPTTCTLLPESSNPKHRPLTVFVLEDDAPSVTPIGKVVWYAVRYDKKEISDRKTR